MNSDDYYEYSDSLYFLRDKIAYYKNKCVEDIDDEELINIIKVIINIYKKYNEKEEVKNA